MLTRLGVAPAVGVFGVAGLAAQRNATDYTIPPNVILITFSGKPREREVAKIVSTSTLTLAIPADDPGTPRGSVSFHPGRSLGQIARGLRALAFDSNRGCESSGNPPGSKGYTYINKNAPSAYRCKVLLIRENIVPAFLKGTQRLLAPWDEGFNPDVSVVLEADSNRCYACATAPHFKEKLESLIKGKDSRVSARGGST